jgi:membrane-bound lytic murein transglycosylase D
MQLYQAKTESIVLSVDSLKAKARQEELSLPPEQTPVMPKSSYVSSGYKIIYHKIKPGETISTIAQKYHVSQNSIMTLNHLQNTRIVSGKTLKIKVKAR